MWVRYLYTFLLLTVLLITCTFTDHASAATRPRVGTHLPLVLHGCKSISSRRNKHHAAPASLSEGEPGGVYSQTFGAIEG